MKLYDLRSSTEGGLHLEALTKEDGEKKIQHYDPPFLPYAYCSEEDFAQWSNHLRHNGYQLGDDAPEGYVRIEHEDPYQIRSLKWEYEDDPVEFYEADVQYPRRVMINEGISVDPPDKEDILYFDIEVDPSGGFPSPDEAPNRVVSIAAQGGDGEEYFMWHQNEQELLQEFIDLCDEYYIISGWNSERFDWPYLKNRCERYGLYLPEFSCIHVDLYTLYRDIIGNDVSSYSLDNVGQHELDMGKEFNLGDDTEVDMINEWFENRDEKLREYNMRDVEITRKIDEKYTAVEFFFRMAMRSSVRAAQLIYLDGGGTPRIAVGRCCDSVILQVANEDGIPMNNRGKYKDLHDFPGGHVFDPIEGVHRDVITSDFSGMYPSIIRTWNIGPDTWNAEIPDDTSNVNLGASALVDSGCTEVFSDSSVLKSSGCFDQGKDSVLKKAIERLQDERTRYKKKRDAATYGSDTWKKFFGLDGSIKALLNSFYGIIASPLHRYYIPGMSENVTEIGQTLIGETKAYAENDHPDVDYVIYGDTDSIIMKLNADDRDTIDVAMNFSEALNNHIKDIASSVCGVSTDMLHIDLDEVFSDYVITSKKKKYAGYVVYDDGYCYSKKITGFACIKSNTPECIANFQESLIDSLLNDESQREIIETAKSELFMGKYDEQLIKRVGLGDPVDEYERLPVHARAAKMIQEKKGAGAIRQGDKVPFIKYGDDKEDVIPCDDGIDVDWRPNENYCPECNEVISGDHEHETMDGPHFRSEQYSYFWRKKFEKIMDRLNVGLTSQQKLGDYNV